MPANASFPAALVEYGTKVATGLAEYMDIVAALSDEERAAAIVARSEWRTAALASFSPDERRDRQRELVSALLRERSGALLPDVGWLACCSVWNEETAPPGGWPPPDWLALAITQLDALCGSSSELWGLKNDSLKAQDAAAIRFWFAVLSEARFRQSAPPPPLRVPFHDVFHGFRVSDWDTDYADANYVYCGGDPTLIRVLMRLLPRAVELPDHLGQDLASRSVQAFHPFLSGESEFNAADFFADLAVLLDPGAIEPRLARLISETEHARDNGWGGGAEMLQRQDGYFRQLLRDLETVAGPDVEAGSWDWQPFVDYLPGLSRDHPARVGRYNWALALYEAGLLPQARGLLTEAPIREDWGGIDVWLRELLELVNSKLAEAHLSEPALLPGTTEHQELLDGQAAIAKRQELNIDLATAQFKELERLIREQSDRGDTLDRDVQAARQQLATDFPGLWPLVPAHAWRSLVWSVALYERYASTEDGPAEMIAVGLSQTLEAVLHLVLDTQLTLGELRATLHQATSSTFHKPGQVELAQRLRRPPFVHDPQFWTETLPSRMWPLVNIRNTPSHGGAAPWHKVQTLYDALLGAEGTVSLLAEISARV